MKQITIDFRNIILELENGKFNIVFLDTGRMFLEDEEKNLYGIGFMTYLDRLIERGEKLVFNFVPREISENIQEYRKEMWSVSEVRDFMKRQMLV